MERIRVLIADDEGSVRDALSDLVSSDPSMELVGTAADADQAIALALDRRPDVALIDVKMPAGGGARAAREIRAGSPRTHVVALSAYEDRRTVLEMLRAGVVGYVVKGTAAEEILHTIRRSTRGQGSLSVEVTADVIHELATLLERSESLGRELQELNRTKSELIQILSHELFTPITTIQGFAMTVAEHGADLPREEMAHLAEGVARASDRIRRLVGNLAATSRLDREGVHVATRPAAVGDLVQLAVQEFPRTADRIRLPDEPGWGALRVWADLDLAARALVVLLENALALSPPDAPVEVLVRPRGTEVDVAVADRGPGVAPEMRERIFHAFTQVDPSSTRNHEGLGIGLYLAQRIMRAHGGGVRVADREGGGSVFTLSLPGFQDPPDPG
ncbi:MAG TPA: ATP-binding protein [Actinomycetota bacterium]|nr:ATP-binding protein [Actinomycetota bacterium]